MGGGDDGKGCDKGCDDDCGKGGCCGGILDGLGCGIGGGVFVDVEALFFRGYVTNVAPAPDFDFEIAPRLSLGYVGPGGLGVRFRYFDFSHDTGGVANAGDQSQLVDTYNIDVELFREIEIGCATTLEWSAGVRYNDFKNRYFVLTDPAGPDVDGEQDQFSGWGLTFGLQMNQCLGPGNFFGRARLAILQDQDATSTDFFGPVNAPITASTVVLDEMVMQTEIAIGYEISRCTNFGVLTGRIAYEMQFWEEYDVANANPVGNNTSFDGFDGIVLGLELAR
jgi:hypothetical protein